MFSSLTAVTRDEGFPSRDELIALYEERTGRSMSRPALVPGARAVEGRGVHGGQLQALRWPARRDDPYLALFDEGVPQLAEAAHEIANAPAPDVRGAAGRLRRGPHHQRLRLLPRVLRARGSRPRHGQAPVPRGPARARRAAQAGEGRGDRGGVRRALRADRGRVRHRRPGGPAVRRDAARRGDDRGGAEGALGRSAHGPDLELLGPRPLRPLGVPTSCSTAW